MFRSRNRRGDHQAAPEESRTGADDGRHVPVRVLTRGPTLAVLAVVAAVVYLADSPPRDLELAASYQQRLRGQVRAIAVHPDSGEVWTCNSDGSLTIWDPGSGQARSISAGADGHRVGANIVEGLSVPAERRDAAAAVAARTSAQWPGLLEASGARAVALALGRDGERVASSKGDGVDIWDPRSGRREGPHVRFPGTVRLALTPDGRSLAAGAEDGSIGLWDLTEGGGSKSFRAHTSEIGSLAFSDDGVLLASSGRHDPVVRVWQVSTGRLLAQVDGRTTLLTVALSPGGQALATVGWDGAIRVWDVATERLTSASGGHGGAVTCLAFSPDETAVVHGGAGSVGWYPLTPREDGERGRPLGR